MWSGYFTHSLLGVGSLYPFLCLFYSKPAVFSLYGFMVIIYFETSVFAQEFKQNLALLGKE